MSRFQSPLCRPIEASMLPAVEAIYLSFGHTHVRPICEILTDNCSVEALLFVAVIDAVDRALYCNYGPIECWALTHGKDRLLQTVNMEYLGAVLERLPAAGRNYQRLQDYLATLSLGWCTVRARGACCTTLSRVEAWYTCSDDQGLRSRLDLNDPGRKGDSDQTIRTMTTMKEHDLEVVNFIVRNTRRALGLPDSDAPSAA